MHDLECRPDALHCRGCGRTESTEWHEIDRRHPNLPDAQRRLAAGDMDVVWLIPCDGSFVEARFCHACGPTGSVLDIECIGCGDGPLVLLGETLPGMPVDERVRERAVTHLRRTGWRTDVNDAMRCPGCTARS